jgi:hypothetical protein
MAELLVALGLGPGMSQKAAAAAERSYTAIVGGRQIR